MELSASGMRIGNKHLCLHTLSQTEDLPTEVSTDNRFERLSTDRSDCRLSFAAPVGLLLSCNHIYNQYVFIDNSDETLQKFEKTARNMHSLSRYSRQNAINKEWIDEYLNEAHSQGLQSVRAHFNVMAWGEELEEKYIRKKPPQIQGVAISYYCVIFSNRKFSSINLCTFVSNFLLFWRRVSNK